MISFAALIMCQDIMTLNYVIVYTIISFWVIAEQTHIYAAATLAL